MKLNNLRSGLVILTASIVLVGSACNAQDTPPANDLKQNPLAMLKAFEAPADQPYQLGRGDEITVEVIGRTELTSKHTIGPDGKITLPIAGSLLIADKTREEAAAAIQTALSTYYTGVTVSVGVDKYTSNHILLLGAVANPGLLSFDKTPTLLEVISRGGQLQAPAPIAGGPGAIGTSTAIPAGVPEECMIYRGNATMITVQLRSLLEEGNSLSNMRLMRDDVVFVPGPDKYVSVLGSVTRPGNQRLETKSTLPQLLAMAGGITPLAGRNPDIQIIHRGTDKSPGKTQVVPYKALLDSKPLDLTIKSGDIIYIPQSGFNNFAVTMEKLAPLVNLVTIGALIR